MRIYAHCKNTLFIFVLHFKNQLKKSRFIFMNYLKIYTKTGYKEITTTQASQLCGVDIPTAQRWAKTNKIPAPAKKLLSLSVFGGIPHHKWHDRYYIDDCGKIRSYGHGWAYSPKQLDELYLYSCDFQILKQNGLLEHELKKRDSLQDRLSAINNLSKIQNQFNDTIKQFARAFELYNNSENNISIN